MGRPYWGNAGSATEEQGGANEKLRTSATVIKTGHTRWLKVFVFLACLIPLGHLVWKGFRGMLGANPIEVITHSTGTWTLTFLMITLAVTPVRKLTGMAWLIRFRRMLGLFAFFYGCLHLMTYVWLDQFFDFPGMLKDIAKRPFITVGFAGFVLMLPLAITSTQGWIRRMGGKRWQMLHRLIYVSALAGVVHYYWLVKADVRVPLIFAAVLAILMSYRLAKYALNLRSRQAPRRRE
jgi:sulfoxide reductase heme-binding subunit YedZ